MFSGPVPPLGADHIELAAILVALDLFAETKKHILWKVGFDLSDCDKVFFPINVTSFSATLPPETKVPSMYCGW
ncbi:hypothetical protein V6N13_014089 [Hibiscus sabdariffa]